ncbi:MAG: bifunctional chorismate mutase/prephenate dehydratase [Kangiellaceae bacterium]|jgi:chorismate mutase/prephenate dehydratase|nr:bifunctional chorismate mutase/prephenate dehydratase [Kangiellaceae bacterium]
MTYQEQLNKLRNDIDHLDIDLINLLAERNRKTQKVGELKVEHNLETRDLDRERVMIENKVDLGKTLGLNSHLVLTIFEAIIAQSVNDQYQMKLHNAQNAKLKVGYLGDQGSYSHQALLKYIEKNCLDSSVFGYRSFKQIVNAVQTAEMDIGILPIENTTTGAILDVYDALQGSGVYLIGEETLAIDHCLVGKMTNEKDITKVYGHPQALSQCNELLSTNQHWEIAYCSSSAEAIEQVIKSQEHSVVAIANKFAATLYKLNVIVSNTANNRENYTRFIIISKEQPLIPMEIPCKVSIVFSTGQQAGALASVLNQFKQNDVVLTKLQSRPVPEMPWEEMFYADLEGHIDDLAVKKSLSSAEPYCKYLKVLGCYPRANLPKAIAG